MRLRILITSLIVFLAGTMGSASARPFQAKTLTATSHVKSWRSKSIPAQPPVYARIYASGKELEQRWASECRADYVGSGLLIRLRVQHCGPGRQSTYTLNYVSVEGSRRFTVVLTKG